MRKVVDDNQGDTDTYLQYSVARVRATTHECSGYSSNFLMFGSEYRAPLDVIMGLPMPTKKSNVSIDDFVAEKVDRMHAAYHSLGGEPRKVAQRQKRYYDLRVEPALFQIND